MTSFVLLERQNKNVALLHEAELDLVMGQDTKTIFKKLFSFTLNEQSSKANSYPPLQFPNLWIALIQQHIILVEIIILTSNRSRCLAAICPTSKTSCDANAAIICQTSGNIISSNITIATKLNFEDSLVQIQ